MWPFKPTWMSKDWKQALRAVGQLTDQKELKNVALNAQDVRVRKLAVERLTDPKALLYIAINGRGCWIDANCDVRKMAIEKLTDLPVLYAIANSHDYERYVCKWMVGDGSQALVTKTLDLRDVACNKLHELREKALKDVENLTDQALLAGIAQNAVYSDVCLVAADRLDDKALAQKAYADIALNSEGADMRKTAVGKLTDQALLVVVAQNAKYGKIRLMAADRLDDKDLAEEVYVYVAQNSEDQDMRKGAVEKLTDHEVLVDIARNAKYNDVRLAAADRLGDKALAEEVYADIAKRGK